MLVPSSSSSFVWDLHRRLIHKLQCARGYEKSEAIQETDRPGGESDCPMFWT